MTRGRREFKWTEGDLMPQELVNVLMETPEEAQVDESLTDMQMDEVPEMWNLTDFIFSDV